MRNNRGFAMAITLALLPILLAAFLSLFCLLGLTQSDLLIKSQCRLGGQAGQKQVAPLLQTLLQLNPLAQGLRLKQMQNSYAITQAIAAENPIALASALKQKLKITRQRQELEGRQKQLIRQSNVFLHTSFLSSAAKIERGGKSIRSLLLDIDFHQLPNQAPRLAVVPKDSDLAPIYELAPDFEDRQALAHEWQYRIKVQSPFNNFLRGDFVFKKSCAVTLEKEGSAWASKIIAGRFSSKPAW